MSEPRGILKKCKVVEYLQSATQVQLTIRKASVVTEMLSYLLLLNHFLNGTLLEVIFPRPRTDNFYEFCEIVDA